MRACLSSESEEKVRESNQNSPALTATMDPIQDSSDFVISPMLPNSLILGKAVALQANTAPSAKAPKLAVDDQNSQG